VHAERVLGLDWPISSVITFLRMSISKSYASFTMGVRHHL